MFEILLKTTIVRLEPQLETTNRALEEIHNLDFEKLTYYLKHLFVYK